MSAKWEMKMKVKTNGNGKQERVKSVTASYFLHYETIATVHVRSAV